MDVQGYPKGLKPQPFNRYVSASPSGNVNSLIIFNLFKHHIIPDLRRRGYSKKRWIFMKCDLHVAHQSAALLELLESEKIFIHFMPGHATHLLQGLDVVIFDLFKPGAKKDIQLWFAFLRKYGLELKIEDFPFVIQHAYWRTHTAELIDQAFDESGVC